MEIKKKINEAFIKENKNEEAENLRERFIIAEKETEEEQKNLPGKLSLTPTESLHMKIINNLAYNIAEYFEDMIDGKKVDIAKSLVCRMNECDGRTAVEILRAMFLITGDERAAKELDLLDVCAEFYDYSYDWFIEDLFDFELFEWILMEACIEDAVYSHALLFLQY